MRLITFTPLIAFLFALPAFGQTSPTEVSCEILDLIGQNRSGKVQEVLVAKTASWNPASRDGLVERLEALLLETSFSGGTLYGAGKLGNDFEEHLLLLRLAKGEIAGARLSYEWTPVGLTLTNLEFKSDLHELMAQPFLSAPVAIRCVGDS